MSAIWPATNNPIPASPFRNRGATITPSTKIRISRIPANLSRRPAGPSLRRTAFPGQPSGLVPVFLLELQRFAIGRMRRGGCGVRKTGAMRFLPEGIDAAGPSKDIQSEADRALMVCLLGKTRLFRRRQRVLKAAVFHGNSAPKCHGLAAHGTCLATHAL